MTQSRNSAVAIAKYLAALLVIGIHTNPFIDINDTINFFAVKIVGQMAVPFFAVCTGYYLGNKLSFGAMLEKTNSNLQLFIRQWKKVFVLYFIWTCLYLVFSIPFWIQTGWLSPMAFVDYAFATVTDGSHYHLWYLLYLLYSLPLAYILLRLVPAKRQWLLILICWAIAIFTYTYKSFLPTGIMPSLGLLNHFSRLPILPPLILLGVQVGRERARRAGRRYAVSLVISFGLLNVEAFTLRNLGIEKVSYIICTLPKIYFLFHLILEFAQFQDERKAKCAILLGNLSTIVYCIHPMFIETIGKKIAHNIWTYFVVALISTAMGYVGYLLKKRLESRLHN